MSNSLSMSNGALSILTDDDFARLMQPLGPFEEGVRLAVALSGGADSLALVVMADAWARARGGSVIAFTVDHGLRAEAADEARRVAAQMQRLGIACEVLHWTGAKPARGIQMAAREARYELLVAACRARGILHLLVGHHAGDQAETVAIRAERGSGPAGLSGMAALALPPLPGPRWPRLLRPLLTVPKATLVARLLEMGEDWIEDPSNRNPVYTRVRVREAMDDAAAAGFAVAARDAQGAAEQEARDLLPFLVRDVTMHGAGFANLVPEPFAGASEAVLRAGWLRVLMTVGGLGYPPRGEELDRLMARVVASDFRGATLGGCRIEPGVKVWRVMREAAAVRDQLPFRDGMMWDGRFLLTGIAEDMAGDTTIKACGDVDIPGLPAMVRRSLPGVWQGGRCLGLPRILGVDVPESVVVETVSARFLPPKALFY